MGRDNRRLSIRWTCPFMFCFGRMMMIIMIIMMLMVSPLSVTAQLNRRDYRLEDLLPCGLSTVGLTKLGPNDVLEPCIVFDIRPVSGGGATAIEDNTTSVIPLVQVTPSSCGNHRDGAVMGVQKMNNDNDGQGVAIGFHQDHYVQFTLTSIIAGNPAHLSSEEYDRRHDQLLRSFFETYKDMAAPYIIGSCSFAASIEKGPANDYQAMVLSQVGPPGFYTPDQSNPYVFGFHINSDTYPLPNVQSLGFQANVRKSQVPVRVIYRNKSEFFYSTCQSAIDQLTQDGFTDLKAILYDHSQDEDGDGDINQFDVDFLHGLADEACPFHLSNDPNQSFHPAIFVCTLTEHDILLQRWLETGCRPQSLWVTAATWGWADANPDQRPYLQGGGQWHEQFDYQDAYFESGSQLLQQNQAKFGYTGNYDQVVSYAIPVLLGQHLQAAYRVTDVPTPLDDFADPDGRERLRRAMLVLNVETLFGPVAFNEHQRNIGRGAAGTQWLPLEKVNDDDDDDDDGFDFETSFRNALVSPLLQAEASTVIPAASAAPCPAGNFANVTARIESGSLLSSGCEACPVDTYMVEPSQASQCKPCPEGSGTDGMVGSDRCYAYEDNLLSGGILALGYVASSVTWILAIGFMAWLIRSRHDPVVKVSQVEFLALICIGAMISSSSVIAISLQAGRDLDTSAASAGCTAAPFLYAIGWVLQYSSLSAKTYRLFQTMLNTKRMKRVAITALHTLPIVIGCLLIDVIIVIVWTVQSPLVYERVEESRKVDEDLGLVTISTVGRCVSSNDNFWQYAGPVLGFHVLLVIGTNLLLCNVRDIADRYQEQKYVAMASALMLEILLVGIPVLVSVNDSADATFIVLTAIVALDDIAVLCCIFGPKISFQRKGLQQGVQFGESIMRETHKRASVREFSRRSVASEMQGEFRHQHGSSGASPDDQSGPFKKSADISGEPEDQRPPSVQRRDSFSKKIVEDRNRLRWHTNSSAVESIAEETSEDLFKELEDSGRQGSDRSSSSDQNKPTFQRSSNGYMMTPAGMVNSAEIARQMDPSNSDLSEDTYKQTSSGGTSTVFDAEKAMQDHARMTEITRKLMEDHERMMKATAEIMNQHQRLTTEFQEGKAATCQDGDGEAKHKSQRGDYAAPIVSAEGHTNEGHEGHEMADTDGGQGQEKAMPSNGPYDQQATEALATSNGSSNETHKVPCTNSEYTRSTEEKSDLSNESPQHDNYG